MSLKCNNCKNCEYCEFQLFKRFLSERNAHRIEKDIATIDNKHDANQCEKCKKVFTRHNILTKHIPKCKGIRDMLVCEFCSASFNTYPSSRYRHYKTCKKKAEFDMAEHNNLSSVPY